jgi:hypothetical protein
MSNKLRESTQTLVNASLDAINGLADFWPLTLRQIYYQLVSRLAIENRIGEYKRLSRILSEARIAGLVPWEAMEDRSRATLVSGGWADARSFIQDEAIRFCRGYRRDLLQQQRQRLEIWVEKDALASIIHHVAFDYCVPVVVARGFSSTSYVKQCADRINANLLAAKQLTRVLYFGDFDPSGWEMPEAMQRKLVDQMGVCPVSLNIERCALLPQQIKDHELPENPEAMKEGDSRTAKFLQLFGWNVSPVELDALHPEVLQEIVREAIFRNLSMDEFERQQRIENSETAQSERIAGQVREFVSGQLSRETD